MADGDKVDAINDYEPKENDVQIVYFKFSHDVLFRMCVMASVLVSCYIMHRVILSLIKKKRIPCL